MGGARSGKSSFALLEASKIEGQKAYIATAEVLDEEMKERIEKHIFERGGEWDTYEEPLKIDAVLSEVKDTYNVVLLDCLTMWLSNLLIRKPGTKKRIKTVEECIIKFIDAMRQLKNSSVSTPVFGLSVLYIVSNEVGMGIVPENKVARHFRDLAGMLNQKIAEIAHEVYLVTAGIPVKIK